MYRTVSKPRAVWALLAAFAIALTLAVLPLPRMDVNAATATIGTTAVGPNADYMLADRKRVNKVALSQAGSVSKLSMYLTPTRTAGSQKVTGLLYSDSAGKPASLLRKTTEIAFSSTMAAGWRDLTFATPVSLAAGTYWIGVISGGTSGVTGFRWTSVSGSRAYNTNAYTSGPTSPFGTPTVDSEKMSLYATYTPAVTSTPSPTVSPTASPKPSPTPSPTATVTASPVPTTNTGRALHIHHGWDMATPGQVAAHAALIDSRPMDGITVYLPTLSDGTLSTAVYSQAQYASALSGMPTLNKVKHNFVIVRTMHSLDWYNDAAWVTISNNFANLAAAAKAKGQFDGIFFDTEFYGSGTYPWGYGSGSTPWSGTGGATPGHTPADASAKVKSRGTQVGQAIGRVWPGASVISTYGPWVGETKTVSTGGWSTFGYNDTAYANELMGCFTGGFVGAYPAINYVDGGEVYQAHTAAEYAKAFSWMNGGIAAAGSLTVPTNLSYPYGTAVSVGFGVYDRDFRVSGWPVMSASLWQSVMTNALSTGEKYVWSYSEAYDWTGIGHPSTPVPASILTATQNAMNAAT